jgi:hypothetical protein
MLKWFFGIPNLSRADLVVILGLGSLWNAHVIEWWVLPLVFVPWIFASVVIEMLIFGDDYVSKRNKNRI